MEKKLINPKKRREQKVQTIYTTSQISRPITIPLKSIGKNLDELIEKYIQSKFEGKCIEEGFIKQDSTKIITYSSGVIFRGSFIRFHVVFKCEICFPVEGMLLDCVVKNFTKASGIRAESATESPSPIIVYINKDHHFDMSYFEQLKVGDRITVRVIGQRFELHDKFISIIGELIKPKEQMYGGSSKPKLVIENKPKYMIEDEDSDEN